MNWTLTSEPWGRMMVSLVMRMMVSSLLGDEYDDDDVEVRVPSLWHGLDFDIGALGEDSLAGNSDTLFAYLDNTSTLEH